jgi:hypothetical protein
VSATDLQLPRDEALIQELIVEESRLAQQAELIDARRSAIKARLRTLGPGTYPAHPLQLRIGIPVERLDLKGLAAAYPFTSSPGLYKPVIDATLASKFLGSHELEPFTRLSAAAVSIGVLRAASQATR